MAYPVTLSEVKNHLRIDPDNFDDDQYIETFIIPAAVEMCNIFVDPSSLLSDASCPYMVKMGILVTCGDLYEKRNSDELSSVKRNDIIQRVLLPHKKIYW